MKYPQINYIIQSVSHDTITKDEKIIKRKRLSGLY